jgi:hypothetical protein
MSFPPQSQGGGYGPPPPPTGGGSYGPGPGRPRQGQYTGQGKGQYQSQGQGQGGRQDDFFAPPPEQPASRQHTSQRSAAQPPAGSRGPKIVAIAVGVVVLVAAAVGGIVLGLGGGDGKTGASASGSPADTGAPAAVAGGGGLVRYVVLSPGQCFDHPGLSAGVKQITTRSCDTPHDGEVIANEKLTGAFGSSAGLRSKVLTLCEADAKKRMESVPGGGQYYYYAIYPSLTTYEKQKKNVISCALTLSNKRGGKKLAKPLP